jgi:hypothetical protein
MNWLIQPENQKEKGPKLILTLWYVDLPGVANLPLLTCFLENLISRLPNN